MSVSKMYSEHLYRGSNFSSQNGEGSGGSAEPSNAPGGTDSQPPHTLVLGTVDTVSAWLMEALCQPMSELDKLGTSQVRKDIRTVKIDRVCPFGLMV